VEEQLIDTWRIANRTHRYVLDALTEEALAGAAASKGRSVGEQFAHIHNVRLLWLQGAAPALAGGLIKLEKGQSGDIGALREALSASGKAVAALLEQGLREGRIKGFKPHPQAFLGYLLSHEFYHQGEIGVILTQSGHPLDRKTAYGMWEWGVR
jgi:uncharacterized damage-inducible protein DinB